jgi:hypothetical protein
LQIRDGEPVKDFSVDLIEGTSDAVNDLGAIALTRAFKEQDERERGPACEVRIVLPRSTFAMLMSQLSNVGSLSLYASTGQARGPLHDGAVNDGNELIWDVDVERDNVVRVDQYELVCRPGSIMGTIEPEPLKIEGFHRLVTPINSLVEQVTRLRSNASRQASILTLVALGIFALLVVVWLR